MIKSILSVLVLANFLALFIGIFDPKMVIKWGNNRKRKKVIAIYGPLTLVFYILFKLAVKNF